MATGKLLLSALGDQEQIGSVYAKEGGTSENLQESGHDQGQGKIVP